MTTQLLDRPAYVSEAEWVEIVDALTRRDFLTGGAVLGALGLGLAACGSSGHLSQKAGTGWTFTDDLGRRVYLPRRPTRIASLWDGTTATLWSLGLRDLVASQLAPGNEAELHAVGFPRHGVTRLSVGNTAQVNVEALAAAKPDLILDYAANGKLTTTSQQPTITKVAPVVGINTYGPNVVAIIDHCQRLITALGIQVTDAAAESRYQAAAGKLKQTLTARLGLRVAFCFAGTDILYLYSPAGSNSNPWQPTLSGLGMEFMPVKASSASNAGGFGTVSWELVPELPVDLLLETGGMWPITNPAWKAMPTVKASQAVDTDVWGSGWYTNTYGNYAVIFDRLTDVVRNAKPGIGPK